MTAAASIERRPALVLRVGITGHRVDARRLGRSDLGSLEASLGVLLAEMQAALTRIAAAEASAYAPDPPRLRLIGALADGADQAAARAALARGIELEAVLPFARDEYRRDFAEPTAFDETLARAARVFELAGQRRAAERAYEAAGFVMLRHCDLLIAVWDGTVDDARRGGTTETVAQAFRAGLPILWLRPGESTFRLLSPGGPQDGTTLWDAVASAAPPGPGALDGLIAARVACPADADARARYEAFVHEADEDGGAVWFAYPALLALAGRAEVQSLPPPPDTPLPNALRNEEEIDAILEARYALADRLSLKLARIYRSGYVTNFVLAGFAVLFALLGLAVLPALKPLWAGIEVVLIAGILILTRQGTRRRWHDRWVDYRQLAEQLRLLRLGARLGVGMAELARSGPGLRVHPGAAWVGWYQRALQRALPLPDARVDGSYLDAIRERLRRGIVEQQRYHAANGARLMGVHDFLDHWGEIMFFATGLIGVLFVAGAAANAAMHLVDHDRAHDLRLWVSFLCGTLPAFGAALYGIRVQGDFKGTAERSLAAADRLEALAARVETPELLDYAALVRLAEEAGLTLSAELADWSVVYRDKPLSLPA